MNGYMSLVLYNQRIHEEIYPSFVHKLSEMHTRPRYRELQPLVVGGHWNVFNFGPLTTTSSHLDHFKCVVVSYNFEQVVTLVL